MNSKAAMAARPMPTTQGPKPLLAGIRPDTVAIKALGSYMTAAPSAIFAEATLAIL